MAKITCKACLGIGRLGLANVALGDETEYSCPVCGGTGEVRDPSSGPNRIDLEYLRKRLPEVVDLLKEAADAADDADNAGSVADEIEADLSHFLYEAFLRPGIVEPIREAIAEAPEIVSMFTGGRAIDLADLSEQSDIDDFASVLAAGLAAAIIAARRRANTIAAQRGRRDVVIVCDDGDYPDDTHRSLVADSSLTITMTPLGTRIATCGTDEEWAHLREKLRACERPASVFRAATIVSIRPPVAQDPGEEDGAS
jgi:hypothetical protein